MEIGRRGSARPRPQRMGGQDRGQPHAAPTGPEALAQMPRRAARRASRVARRARRARSTPHARDASEVRSQPHAWVYLRERALVHAARDALAPVCCVVCIACMCACMRTHAVRVISITSGGVPAEGADVALRADGVGLLLQMLLTDRTRMHD